MAVTVEHREGWHRLFADYCMGGGGEAGPEHLATVWGWLMSPAAQTRGLVALADGLPAGLANYRVFERPITGTTGVWIDDLFVDRAYRRRG
ncbi:MAG: GNAT family N-acetyltransferase, partial [Cellulomonas sp.]|nr:GNAT family N-acetyltransferase [Cellulomonas sp.]